MAAPAFLTPWVSLLLLLIAAAFVTCACRTIAARYARGKARHELIVEARRLRREYDDAVAEREAELLEQVGYDIDDDGLILVG